MRSHDVLRQLDPLDRDAAPPDGEPLLRALLAAPPVQSGRRRARRRALAVVPVALTGALIVAVGLVARSDEEQPAAGPAGATIVHYTTRETMTSHTEPARPPQVMATSEVWQLSDGTRERSVSRSDGPNVAPDARGESETVLTPAESLTFVPGRKQIIRYRVDDDFSFLDDPAARLAEPEFGPRPLAGAGLPRQVGDPRTLPDRADRREKGVRPLGEATVRGVPVDQYQVGACDTKGHKRRASPPTTVVGEVDERAVVSLARGTGTPVRAEIAPCDMVLGIPPIERTVDYLTFEVLPGTAENRRLLHMSPHPGVPVLDGIEIDRAEERDEG